METTFSPPRHSLLDDIKQWNMIIPDDNEFHLAGRRAPKVTEAMYPRWEVAGGKVKPVNKNTSFIHSIQKFVSGDTRLDVVFDHMHKRLSEFTADDLTDLAKTNTRWRRNLQKLDVNIQSKLDKVGANYGFISFALAKLGIVPDVKAETKKNAEKLTALIRKHLTAAHETDVPVLEVKIRADVEETPRKGKKVAKKKNTTDKTIDKAKDKITDKKVYDLSKPLNIYSTPKDGDLRGALISAISQAEKSIHMLMYSLTDIKIIEALEKKAQEGVEVIIAHDENAFKYAPRKLDDAIKTKAVDTKKNALMHCKLISIDDEFAYLGSANLTTEALTKDKNLFTFVRHQEVASLISKKAKSIFESTVGDSEEEKIPAKSTFVLENNTQLELSLLPDDTKADDKLLEVISQTKKTLEIAMFTFTREDVAKKVIDLHKGGKKVQIILDGQQANGAGKKIAQMLQEAGVPTLIAKPNHFLLIHHKFARIDGTKIVHGSANYTKNAFDANWDYIVFLDKLKKEEKLAFEEMWNALYDAVSKQSKVVKV